jgi:hypothetical protein
MASIPDSTKTSLRQRLIAHANQNWPGIRRITTTYRGRYAYIAATTDNTDDDIKLLRLGYGGYATTWRVALYRASHNDYQPTLMPDGTTATTPEQALDLAANLYLPQTRRTNDNDH